jgi:small-conductance mechanosensitive channel
MTVYTPLVSGIRGLRDDNPAGHLERRHQPFTHPMENAMSPSQFDQLKQYLEQMAAGFATKEEYDTVVADLTQQLSELQKDNAALKDSLAAANSEVDEKANVIADLMKQAEAAEARAVEAEAKSAEAESHAKAETEAKKDGHHETAKKKGKSD